MAISSDLAFLMPVRCVAFCNSEKMFGLLSNLLFVKGFRDELIVNKYKTCPPFCSTVSAIRVIL